MAKKATESPTKSLPVPKGKVKYTASKAQLLEWAEKIEASCRKIRQGIQAMDDFDIKELPMIPQKLRNIAEKDLPLVVKTQILDRLYKATGHEVR